MTGSIPQILTLELREPPSANRWWRNVRGRMVTSAEAREYKQYLANLALVRRIRPLPADVSVAIDITWYRGRRSGDLDKRLGVLLDALQGVAYVSDAQLTTIFAARQDDPGNAHVRVRVWRDEPIPCSDDVTALVHIGIIDHEHLPNGD